MRKIIFIELLVLIIFISGCIQEDSTDKIYTPNEIWKNRESLVNKQIIVEGIIDYYQVSCTEMACPRGCCNSCGGGLGLRIEENRVLNVRGESEEKGNFGLYNGKRVGCSGNECDIKCYPLEKGKKYRITSILKKETLDIAPYEEFYLLLKNFELTYDKPITASEECTTDNDCKTGGCSGTICQSKDAEPIFTTCEYLPEYACYKQIQCKCINNKCQWDKTEEFNKCIEEARKTDVEVIV